MNNKGQALSFIIFFGVIIATFIIALIILYAANTILHPFAAGVGNVTTSAGEAVNSINTKFTGMWDWVIFIFFVINVLLLLVSAYLVDVSPAWLVIYIVSLFFLFIFGSTALYSVQSIWGTSQFSTTVTQMPITNYIMNNAGLVLLAIAILSGIVMYAKIKFGSNQASGGY